MVTQSIKKLSKQLQDAVFNDYEYKLLSNDKPITINELKQFDKNDESNINLYNDTAYKIIEADSLLDVGLLKEKITSDGHIKK